MSLNGVWAILVLFIGAVVLVQILMLHGLSQRVAQAADLAALAGSRASLAGESGCDAAKRIATENGAKLAACRMDADVATVTATGAFGKRPFHFEIKKRARAAPDFYLR